ncbi:unnamed protein product, partial [Cyprideis torosa]
IVTWPTSLERRLYLPDPNDIHVLAAAISGSADIIVTLNVSDFPRNILAEEGLSRADPDAFLLGYWQAQPDLVAQVGADVLSEAQRLSGRNIGMRELLKKARLPRLAKAMAAVKYQTPRLEVCNLTRRYDDQIVVNDVSLCIAPGHVTCLLGPSGCGKSTTLRMVAGVERQDAGSILVDGAVISDSAVNLPPERRSVGLMFQDFALFPHLSVADNVGFGLKTGRDQKRARVEELLSEVGLARFIDVFPHELSGGEQQRVALARALAPRPGIMLMDEPFSGLD